MSYPLNIYNQVHKLLYHKRLKCKTRIIDPPEECFAWAWWAYPAAEKRRNEVGTTRPEQGACS